MARTFPSSSDFINEASIGSIDVLGSNITIHAWVKPTKDGMIVNRFGGSAGAQQFFMQRTSGNLQVAISDGASDTATGATTMTTGAWHSCGLRKADSGGSGVLEAWLDGVMDGSVASPRAAQGIGGTAGSRYVIGLRSSVALSWGGAIAEVAVWLVTLTTDEMVALSKGASPLMVRPGDLYHYHPIWGVSPEIDLDATKINLNVSGNPPRADHAPVGCPFPVAT